MRNLLNHTPGPWRAEGRSIKAVDHGKWFTVARVHSEKLTKEGNQENALLIAGAPAMLEALRSIADGTVMQGNMPYSHADVVLAYQELARKVIRS